MPKTIAILIIASLLSVAIQPLRANIDTLQENGEVTDVTLYRNQARVTRTVYVEGRKGEFELVISELPENIVPNSLFAEGINDTEIRAVQFRTRAVGQSPRKEVRDLQEQIAANQKDTQFVQKQNELLKKQLAYLDKMENFVAPTATTELSKGVLDAEALERVTEFNFAKREEIAKREIELDSQLGELNSAAELLKRKLNEISNNASKTVREAVLFVRANEDRRTGIRVSYLVNSCGWSPSYSVRAKSKNPDTTIEYNGLIRQMSGEDWGNVKLTLSTATPSLSSSGPGLAPFSINLILDQNGQAIAGQTMQQAQLRNMYQEKDRQILAIQNSTNLRDNFGNSWGLNKTVNAMACVEIGFSNHAASGSSSQIEAEQEPCLSYELPERVTLTSRNSQQMVRIIQTNLPGDFYYVATPVLTSYVFREAELNNNGDADFLAGPINVYLDDRFVGRGEIPTVARGQSFVIGFGADSQLRTRRELVDRKTNINGGNREITVDYRLVVENYKETPVTIRVTDRLPKPLQKKDIRVTMDNPETPLSTDNVYVRSEKPHGILRWDAEVPARSMGDELFEIGYSYSLEFDRKFQIALASDESQEQMQFEEIQARRIKR